MQQPLYQHVSICTIVRLQLAEDLPLYTTTLGMPNDDLTLEKTWATESGSDRSAAMLIISDELLSSLALLDVDATLYPFAMKAFATWCPTLAPEPKMRITFGTAVIVWNGFVALRFRSNTIECKADILWYLNSMELLQY